MFDNDALQCTICLLIWKSAVADYFTSASVSDKCCFFAAVAGTGYDTHDVGVMKIKIDNDKADVDAKSTFCSSQDQVVMEIGNNEVEDDGYRKRSRLILGVKQLTTKRNCFSLSLIIAYREMKERVKPSNEPR